MLVKNYLNKYGKLVIKDKDRTFYSNGKDQIGGIFKKNNPLGML